MKRKRAKSRGSERGRGGREVSLRAVELWESCSPQTNQQHITSFSFALYLSLGSTRSGARRWTHQQRELVPMTALLLSIGHRSWRARLPPPPSRWLPFPPRRSAPFLRNRHYRRRCPGRVARSRGSQPRRGNLGCRTCRRERGSCPPLRTSTTGSG